LGAVRAVRAVDAPAVVGVAVAVEVPVFVGAAHPVGVAVPAGEAVHPGRARVSRGSRHPETVARGADAVAVEVLAGRTHAILVQVPAARAVRSRGTDLALHALGTLRALGAGGPKAVARLADAVAVDVLAGIAGAVDVGVPAGAGSILRRRPTSGE
jgi:hypothetical protein